MQATVGGQRESQSFRVACGVSANDLALRYYGTVVRADDTIRNTLKQEPQPLTDSTGCGPCLSNGQDLTAEGGGRGEGPEPNWQRKFHEVIECELKSIFMLCVFMLALNQR